jgi:hypothetical protein
LQTKITTLFAAAKTLQISFLQGLFRCCSSPSPIEATFWANIPEAFKAMLKLGAASDRIENFNPYLVDIQCSKPVTNGLCNFS